MLKPSLRAKLQDRHSYTGALLLQESKCYLSSFSWTIDLTIIDAGYTQARVMNSGNVRAMVITNLNLKMDV